MIRELIQNYIEQERLYQKVAVLSIKQASLLQNQPAVDSAQIRELLQPRQEIMDEIAALNDKARHLQEQMKETYDLKAFTLSAIKGIISSTDYRDLSQVLDQMGEILKSISQSDLKNQTLMRQAAGDALNRPSTSSLQASSAYRQAMDHNKN